MNFAFILFLFCLIWNGFRIIVSGKEVLSVNMEEVVYAEDRKLILNCILMNALDDTNLDWKLRTTRHAEPFDVVEKWRGGTNLNGTKFVMVDIRLRRDYSNTEIFCYTSTGQTANFPISDISVSWLPSFDIKLESSLVIQGGSTLPKCKVSYSKDNVNTIQVNLKIGLIKTKNLITETLGKETLYYFEIQASSGDKVVINMEEHNNFPIQCVAVIQDSKGKNGTIYSVVENLVVYHMEIKDGTFPDTVFGISGKVDFALFLYGNPIPKSRKIFIRKVDEPKLSHDLQDVVNVTSVKNFNIKLWCHFRPPMSGRYMFVFKSNKRNYEAKSKIFNIVMIALIILQKPTGIERTEVATVTAKLKITEAPQKKFMSVFRLEGNKVVEKLDFDVTGIIRSKENDYRFEMLIHFNTSSYYFITYKFINFTIKSEPFPIHIYGISKTPEKVIPIIVFLMVMIAILFFACINDKIRSCKAEALAEDDFELIFPRPEKTFQFTTSSALKASLVSYESYSQ